MLKKMIAGAAILCSSLLPIYAQSTDSYNYTRGVEEIQNDNPKAGIEYLKKELDANPRNGFAWGWLASVYYNDNEYGLALTAVNRALKYIPKKDSGFLSYSYSLRGDIYYHQLDELDKALADYTKAIQLSPENTERYESRANFYYYINEYDLSDKDYRKIIELNEGGTLGYMGLGRNANAQGRYEDAIKHFDYVNKLFSDYTQSHSFRAESNIGLGRFGDAADDVINALNIDYDKKAISYLTVLADSAFIPITTKLKMMKTKNPGNEMWSYYLGHVYEEKDKFGEASEFYRQAFQLNPIAQFAHAWAYSSYRAGNYPATIDITNHQLDIDPSDVMSMALKAMATDAMDDTDGAIQLFSEYIEQYPQEAGVYFKRGILLLYQGQNEKAIEDFTAAIAIDPTVADMYASRGTLYSDMGQLKEAVADFQKVIELHPKVEAEDLNVVAYAYMMMGETDKAKELADEYLATKRSATHLYDVACIYSKMGEQEQALDYLKQTLERGYSSFRHIRRDRDFTGLHDVPAFHEMIDHYEQLFNAREKAAATDYTEQIAEVPFTREKGVFKVNCNINNLPLYFIFDTGASDVSISTVEATFMLKNNYLSSEDVIGKQNFMTATGEISEGTVVNLRNVNFGGMDLSNVRASVVKSQNAPLLLGQSVLSRLGKIEIDNEKKVLKIYYKVQQ